jgi:hypothetical protein
MASSGAQTRNVDFVEPRFTGQTGFSFVPHSATSNGLQSSNQFCFQGNAVSIVYGKVCATFLL